MSEIAAQISNQILPSDWPDGISSRFYGALSQQELAIFLSRSGLGQNDDLHILKPYFQNAKQILDVGAGFGRLADWYAQQSYQGQLTCLEQVPTMCSHIKQNHQQTNKVSVVCADIKAFQSNQKYDLIVWLWSGLNDLKPQEQNAVTRSLASLLSSNGMIVIDTFHPGTTGINTQQTNNGYYIVTYGSEMLYGFNPSFEMIQEYTSNNRLLLNQVKCYTTPGGVERVMYFISHLSE